FAASATATTSSPTRSPAASPPRSSSDRSKDFRRRPSWCKFLSPCRRCGGSPRHCATRTRARRWGSPGTSARRRRRRRPGRGPAPGTKARVVPYGESSDAELRATDARATGLDGLRFAARRGAETADVRLPIPGRHLVTAALAAIGAATELGVPLDEAAVAL